MNDYHISCMRTDCSFALVDIPTFICTVTRIRVCSVKQNVTTANECKLLALIIWLR